MSSEQQLLFTEKDVEDVLSKHHDYFLENQLTLIGRQQSFRGKRVDLLFKDRFGDTLIVEIKRGVIGRTHVAQVIDYLGLLAEGEPGRIRLMLVADQVPPNWKLALDRQGIEYREITARDYLELLKVKDSEMLAEIKKKITLTSNGVVKDVPKITKTIDIWPKIREFCLEKKGMTLSLLNPEKDYTFTITEVGTDFLKVNKLRISLPSSWFQKVYDYLLAVGGWVEVGASRVSTRPDTVEGIIKTNFYPGNMDALSTATWIVAIMVQADIGVIFNGKAKGQAIEIEEPSINKLVVGLISKPLYTLKESKPFHIVSVEGKNIIIQISNKNQRKVSLTGVENAYKQLKTDGSITLVEINKSYNVRNSSYASSIIANFTGVQVIIKPKIQLYYRNPTTNL